MNYNQRVNALAELMRLLSKAEWGVNNIDFFLPLAELAVAEMAKIPQHALEYYGAMCPCKDCNENAENYLTEQGLIPDKTTGA